MTSDLTSHRIGSLFTGYGGLDMAVEAVTGATTAWVSDIDPGANKIINHRMSGVPNLGDITNIDWSDVEPVDILTGGFPCQDLSHAGRRAGLRPDTRSGLWSHMAYAINELRPSLVVAENVRGLLSARTDRSEQVVTVGPKGGRKVGYTERALGRVLSDLADLGYDACWYGLRAADVGAPHGRFRVFVVAQDTDSAAGHQRRFTAPGQAESGRARTDVGGSGGARALDLLPTPSTGLEVLLPTPAVNDMGASYTPDEWDAWTERMKAEHGNGNGHGKSLSIEAQRLLPTPTTEPLTGNGHARHLGAEVLLPTPSVADVEGGRKHRSGSRSDELLLNGLAHAQRFGQYADAIARWETLTRPAPAPTEPSGRDGAHRLSPRFVEWMMGLPAGHVTDVPDLSRNAQLKALGNGVVPQQAVAALDLLLSTVSTSHNMEVAV